MTLEKSAQQIKEERLGWKDVNNPFPFDALLRMHGWRIHTREKGGEPVWEKYTPLEGREQSPESLALSGIPCRDLTLAEKYQSAYLKRAYG